MARVYFWADVCGSPGTANASERTGVFWDDELTLNTSTPDLTTCFQQTALLWVPCFYLWLAFPFYLTYLLSRPKRNRLGFKHRSWVTLLKLCSGFLLILLAAADLVFHIVTKKDNSWPVSTYLAPTVLILVYITAVSLSFVEYTRAVHSSGVLFLFWLLMVAVGIVTIRSDVIQGRGQGLVFGLVCAAFSVTVLQLVLSLLSDHGVKKRQHSKQEDTHISLKMSDDSEKSIHTPCPGEKASFLSSISFFWITKLIWSGNRRSLTFDDVYQLRADDKCQSVTATFYRSLTKELNTMRFVLALVKTVKGPIIGGCLLQFISMTCQLLTPVILNQLIHFMRSADPYQWKGYSLAVVMTLLQLVGALAKNNSLMFGYVAGMRIRATIIAAVYRKSLKLSNRARKDMEIGKIVNLMSVDSQSIYNIVANFHLIWTTPILVAVSIYLLWQQVGPASLAGLALLCILAVINAVGPARLMMKFQRQQMVHKDRRIKFIHEILNGIKVFKFYAWEQSFFDKVGAIREKELKTIWKKNAVLIVIMGLWLSASSLVTVVLFTIYLFTSGTHSLTPNKAFVSLSIIKLLNFCLGVLPVILSQGAQALVSIKRISKMLSSEELEEDAVQEDYLMGDSIRIEDGEFTWDDDQNPVLRDINLRIEQGKLVAIVGQVGCGKSSILNSMLGELKRIKGMVSKQGSVAYVPQQAWIQNMTLKDNILFGQDLLTSRYEQVLDACALTLDLEILPSGDATEIGEKGVNLSGGQKQRVNLARAVYQDADVYLLDDVLSAVDANIAKHLFNNVIGPNGILKGKTRVLVTHSVTYLPEMDNVLVLNNGRIAESGTYQELLEQNGPFAEFLRNYTSGHDENDDDDMAENQEDFKVNRSVSVEESKDEPDIAVRRRESSIVHQKESKKKEKNKEGTKIIEKEKEGTGRISLKVAGTYVRANGITMVLISVIALVWYTTMAVAQNIWLSKWSDDVIPVNVTEARDLVNFRLGVYGGLGIAYVIGVSVVNAGIMGGGLRASRRIHKILLQRVLHAPASFFDTTPVGRIVNRFSMDMDRVDTTIPTLVRSVSMGTATILRIVIINAYSTPMFLAAFIPIFILYMIIQRFYITSTRQLSRIESSRRSPIYSHFGETLAGASTIRAYRKQGNFLRRNQKLVDQHQMAWYPILVCQSWIAVTLHCLVGSLIVFFASVFAVHQRGTTTAGLAGLSIVFALDTMSQLTVLTKTAADLETFSVSVERIKEYSEVEQEGVLINKDNRPSSDWPSHGEVSFFNYSTRYRPGLDLVLNNISVKITGGEKIGVVGRTGAGKSSMTLALFRLIEAAGGSIYVDGMNIADIGLNDLRSRLTIIPQDPVLFSESLRMNLDPFSKYTDDQLWKALEQAHLKAFVTSLSEGLDFNCGEGGTGLSVGQRQLLCLARALLRKSRVLVMDEATAAVDMETDELIQALIRQEFSQCTVITIAHRINTIMDYDRVMVLDEGRVLEFGEPSTLLADTDGAFHELAKTAGLS